MLAVRADMQDAFGVSIRRDERVDFTQGEQAVIKFDVPENLRSIAFTLNGSVKVCHVLCAVCWGVTAVPCNCNCFDCCGCPAIALTAVAARYLDHAIRRAQDIHSLPLHASQRAEQQR